MHPQLRFVVHETEKEKNIVSCATNQGGENGTAGAWYRYVYHNDGGIYRNSYGKQGGFSVRCLRD